MLARQALSSWPFISTEGPLPGLAHMPRSTGLCTAGGPTRGVRDAIPSGRETSPVLCTGANPSTQINSSKPLLRQRRTMG